MESFSTQKYLFPRKGMGGMLVKGEGLDSSFRTHCTLGEVEQYYKLQQYLTEFCKGCGGEVRKCLFVWGGGG